MENSSTSPLVKVDHLKVRLPTGPRSMVGAVHDVSLEVGRGERVGIVGESGSGKSITVRAISGLLPISPRVEVTGSIDYDGTQLVGASDQTWNTIRSKRIGMIFQDPATYLNPTMKVGKQIREALNRGRDSDHSTAAVYRYMTMAGLPEPEQTAKSYPFQLSGGMRQRVLIAIALAKRPELIIADEPTTALDATVQRRVLASLDDSVRELGTSLLLITHDLAVVAGLCDRIYVMYSGKIVESGSVEDIFYRPQHEYTKELLNCVRSLDDDSAELHVSTFKEAQ